MEGLKRIEDFDTLDNYRPMIQLLAFKEGQYMPLNTFVGLMLQKELKSNFYNIDSYNEELAMFNSLFTPIQDPSPILYDMHYSHNYEGTWKS